MQSLFSNKLFGSSNNYDMNVTVMENIPRKKFINRKYRTNLSKPQTGMLILILNVIKITTSCDEHNIIGGQTVRLFWNCYTRETCQNTACLPCMQEHENLCSDVQSFRPSDLQTRLFRSKPEVIRMCLIYTNTGIFYNCF